MNTLTRNIRLMLSLFGLTLIVCLLPATAAADTVYKSVDAQGNVTFSNIPPPPGSNAQQIELPSGPTPAEEQQSQQQEQSLENMTNQLGNGDNSGEQQPQAAQPVQPTTEYEQGSGDAGDDQDPAVVEEGYVGDRTRNERVRDGVDDVREVAPGPADVPHPAARGR
jgi:hypothetical protein